MSDSTAVSPNLVYLTEQAKGAVKALGEAFKQPAERIYAVMVKQAFIEGIVAVMYVVLSALFLVLYVRFLLYCLREDLYNNKVDDARPIICAMASVIGAVVSAFLLIAAVANAGNAIEYMFNPEYRAIKLIMLVLKGEMP